MHETFCTGSSTLNKSIFTNTHYLNRTKRSGDLSMALLITTSPAGSLLAVKLHSENGVIFKGKYEILISLNLQWQENHRKTMRNQLSLSLVNAGG